MRRSKRKPFHTGIWRQYEEQTQPDVENEELVPKSIPHMSAAAVGAYLRWSRSPPPPRLS